MNITRFLFRLSKTKKGGISAFFYFPAYTLARARPCPSARLAPCSLYCAPAPPALALAFRQGLRPAPLLCSYAWCSLPFLRKNSPKFREVVYSTSRVFHTREIKFLRSKGAVVLLIMSACVARKRQFLLPAKVIISSLARVSQALRALASPDVYRSFAGALRHALHDAYPHDVSCARCCALLRFNLLSDFILRALALPFGRFCYRLRALLRSLSVALALPCGSRVFLMCAFFCAFCEANAQKTLLTVITFSIYFLCSQGCFAPFGFALDNAKNYMLLFV